MRRRSGGFIGPGLPRMRESLDVLGAANGALAVVLHGEQIVDGEGSRLQRGHEAVRVRDAVLQGDVDANAADRGQGRARRRRCRATRGMAQR